MRARFSISISISMLLLAACIPPTAPAVARQLRKESATECVAHCKELGMELSAVVIISNATGCVCVPPGAPVAPGPAAAAAGATVVQMQAEAARVQNAPIVVPRKP